MPAAEKLSAFCSCCLQARHARLFVICMNALCVRAKEANYSAITTPTHVVTFRYIYKLDSNELCLSFVWYTSYLYPLKKKY
jgi:hypothetical protein